MSMSFASPSMRAAGQDLAVSISPLGLVELSDEEFEVHGPRLNRYAQNVAFYLGQHWAYRRENGEPQTTYNYVRAMADFIMNFTYSRGVHFKSPEGTSHIVPALLKRIWEVDNTKEEILYEVGQNDGVYGDAFVKVVYDPAYTDPTGQLKPGRVRILPLNPSFCFPEWHPHDRERLIRFKLKYKFWGTSPEGTRQVYTYTEIMTDEIIEEYINDEMIDQRPNPLGEVPVVHIPNTRISGSPWGLSDVQDIIGLNREYNEKALEVSDIINYHAAPVTIITGAKSSNLERGPKKVWAIPNKDAEVKNLEGGTEAVPSALEFMALVKSAMHEMTGVPESALGQMQPISNTSGVALAIQYQPMMQRYNMKKLTATKGLQKINDLALQTLFLYEPDTLFFNPDTEGLKRSTQPDALDPRDPMTYQTYIHWPEPLPVDALIKLNEVMTKMELGLESKKGALEALGSEFPDEKLEEIFAELVEDAKYQGALDMLKAKIQQTVLATTGIVMGEGEPENQQATKNADGSTSTPDRPAPSPSMVNALGQFGEMQDQALFNDIVTKAYGTKIPQRRSPDNTED